MPLTPPQKTSDDLIYAIGKNIVGILGNTIDMVAGTPGVTSAITLEVFTLLFQSPFEKANRQFLMDMVNDIDRIKQRTENFSLEEILEQDSVVTTIIRIIRIAQVTHNEEKRKLLRNALLNSMLSNAPDEINQDMYISLLGELNPWHIKLLKLCSQHKFPMLRFDHPDWKMMNKRVDLMNIIEETYPEMGGHKHTYLAIIDALHSKGLITHLIPGPPDMMSEIFERATVSPFARGFLDFIRSPLDD